MRGHNRLSAARVWAQWLCLGLAPDWGWPHVATTFQTLFLWVLSPLDQSKHKFNIKKLIFDLVIFANFWARFDHHWHLKISLKAFMRLVDPLKLTKIYFLFARPQSAKCGQSLCPVTLPWFSSGLRLAARRHFISNLIFVSFKSIRPVKTRI